MPKQNNTTTLMILVTLIIMLFIGLYAEHFLLRKPQENGPIIKEPGAGEDNIKNNAKDRPFPVQYKHLSKEISGIKQEIDILEINLNDERVEIKPVLSHDLIFGFEYLSEMVSRSKAYAAVNAGFFHPYGEPGGMVAIDGQIITNSTGKYPVFVIEGRRAEFKEFKGKLWVEYNEGILNVDNINVKGEAGKVVVYTPVYGDDNRAKTPNVTVIVENGVITGIQDSGGTTPIPGSGFLISFFGPVKDIPLKVGDKINLGSEPKLSDTTHGYECGSWIVKDGEVVIGERDEWVGVMTNRDPRTVVGLKNESTVVLMTVDGRQPGYSWGFTGKELGKFLVDYGVKNAAMLDGGASTEMIVNGKMVNRPSFKGKERPLAGGIIVKYAAE